MHIVIQNVDNKKLHFIFSKRFFLDMRLSISLILKRLSVSYNINNTTKKIRKPLLAIETSK